MQTARSEGASETASTVVQETKLDVAHYSHEYVLLTFHQINNPEIALCDINDSHVLSLVQSFLAYGFYHSIGKLSVATIAAASHIEKS